MSQVPPHPPPPQLLSWPRYAVRADCGEGAALLEAAKRGHVEMVRLHADKGIGRILQMGDKGAHPPR